MALWTVAIQGTFQSRYGVLRTSTTDGEPVWEAVGDPQHLSNNVYGLDYCQDVVNPNILHIVVHDSSSTHFWYSQFDMTLETWVVEPIQVDTAAADDVMLVTIAARDNGNAVISYFGSTTDGLGLYTAHWCEYDDATGTISAPADLGAGYNGSQYRRGFRAVRGASGLVHIFLVSSDNTLTHRSITSAGSVSAAEQFGTLNTTFWNIEACFYVDDTSTPRVAVLIGRDQAEGWYGLIATAPSAATMAPVTMDEAFFLDDSTGEILNANNYLSGLGLVGLDDKIFVTFIARHSTYVSTRLLSGFGSTWSTPEEIIHDASGTSESSDNHDYAQVEKDGTSIVLMAYDDGSGTENHTVKYIASSNAYEELDLPVAITSTVTGTDGVVLVEDVVIDASTTVTGTDAGPLGDELLEVLATTVVDVTDQQSLIEQASVSAMAVVEATHVQEMVDDPLIDAISTVTITDDMGGLARTVEVGAITWVAVLATTVRADLAAQWHVRDAVQDDLGILWKVTGPVGKSIEAVWNVEGVAGLDLDVRWDVNTGAGSVGRDLALDWDVVTPVGDEFVTLWDVVQSFTVTVDLDVRWDSLRSASKEVSTTWDTYIVRTEERTLNAAKSPEERRPISRSERRDSDPAVALRVTRT